MSEGNRNHQAADVREFEPRRMPLSRIQPPGDSELHLWFLDLGELAGALRDALGGREDPGAPVRAEQLRFARRFYLRLLLGAYLGLPGKSVRINRKQRGKPVLDVSVHDSEIHFSMAKSEDRLLIGFSTSSHVGVDLEPVTRRARNALGVARRYFTAAEADALAALPGEDVDAAFLRTWACKEAVVKASGLGIANQFGRFTVDTDASHPAAVLDYEGEPCSDWTLVMVRPESQFLGAVAIRGRVTRVSAFRLLPAGKPGV